MIRGPLTLRIRNGTVDPGCPPGIGGYRSGAVLQVEDTFLLVRGSDDFVKLYEGV